MTIHLETEDFKSRHDRVSGMNYYTIARGDRRWTVGIHSDDFDRLGPLDDEAGKRCRREHLAASLDLAMQGPADGEAQP